MKNNTIFQAGRTRLITNSPAEEISVRAGALRSLDDSIVAMFLSRKVFRKISRGGVTVEGKRYWSENSLTSQPGMDARKVAITYNKRDPESIFVFSESGQYIEALPIEGTATWFDNSDESRKAFASVKRHHRRAEDRLKLLHIPDTEKAIADGQENLAKIERVVTTLPLPVKDAEPRKPLSTPTSELITRADKALNSIRTASRLRLRSDNDLAERAEAALEAGY